MVDIFILKNEILFELFEKGVIVLIDKYKDKMKKRIKLWKKNKK